MKPHFKLQSLYFSVVILLLCVGGVAAEAFSFIHISDTHITASGKFKENLAAVAAEANAMNPKPAFVVATGDITEVGLPTEMERYRETISAFQMPVYNVPGNHETKWSNWGKSSITRFFKQEPRYSFTHENIHFVGLDSAVWMQHHGLLDRSMLTWLKNDLEKAGRQTPSVLFYHHCPGFIPNEPELLSTIRPYNVKLILVGHGHTFKTWKRNGLMFQEAKGVMNDTGGYRLLEVSDTEIKSYTKLTGKDKVLDATIPLSPSANPVTLLKPKLDDKVEGPVHLRAMVTSAENWWVEAGIDGTFQPIKADRSGIWYATIPFDGPPGWHTVTIRTTGPDGMEWSESVPVRINASSREAWHIQASGGIQRVVRAYGDKLYLGTLGGDVYCLDARSGREIWKYSARSDVVSEIAVSKDIACFGAADGRVIAVDAKTGKPKWEYKTDGPVLGSAIIRDGKVFIGSSEPAFYALDAASGRFLWKYAMERMTQVLPLYMDGTIYFGAWDKHFHAINARDGSVRWRTPIGISFYYSTANSDPATDGKRIVANVTPYKPEDSDIYCMDAASGNVIWQIRNPAGKSDCGFNSPCVVGDKLYTVNGSGEVFCLSMADGKEISRIPLGITVVGSKPIIADGKVYLTGLRGTVACADLTTGKKLWTYSTGSGYQFCPATVWEDLLIVPSTDGSVTAVYR